MSTAPPPGQDTLCSSAEEVGITPHTAPSLVARSDSSVGAPDLLPPLVSTLRFSSSLSSSPFSSPIRCV